MPRHKVNKLIKQLAIDRDEKETDLKQELATYIGIDRETLRLFLTDPEAYFRNAYLITIVQFFKMKGFTSVKEVADLYEIPVVA